MSTRNNNGSYDQQHQRPAELRGFAEHAHLVTSVSHDQQDHQTGAEHSRQALEHSPKAHHQTDEVHQDFTIKRSPAVFEHEDVAVVAHGLWEARGRPDGSAEEDWFHAAQELQGRPQTIQK